MVCTAQLDEVLSSLEPRHRQALLWFWEKAGTEQPWPGSVDGLFLATKAKGIYKPEWSKYALSVKQTLKGPYPDMEPIERSDGTWTYSYFQEGESVSDRDRFFTNVGLMQCMRDRVPIGVLRQTQGRPQVRYKILGLALVGGWSDGYFHLEGFSRQGYSRGRETVPLGGEMQAAVEESERTFDPDVILDARKRVATTIVQRQGQGAFRQMLVRVYGGRCAFSDCSVLEVLEAAHVTPYLGPESNQAGNGLLLRADLHTLWDLGLLALDEDTRCVLVSPRLDGTVYGALVGKLARAPSREEHRISRAALLSHRRWSRL